LVIEAWLTFMKSSSPVLFGVTKVELELKAQKKKGALENLRDRFTIKEVGWIRDRPAMAELIASAHIYVRSSLTENAPLAVTSEVFQS